MQTGNYRLRTTALRTWVPNLEDCQVWSLVIAPQAASRPAGASSVSACFVLTQRQKAQRTQVQEDPAHKSTTNVTGKGVGEGLAVQETSLALETGSGSSISVHWSQASESGKMAPSLGATLDHELWLASLHETEAASELRTQW